MDLGDLLSYLFGTEDNVELRRQLVLFRENMMNHILQSNGILCRMICSGSLGEGVAYPESDDDLMSSTLFRVVRTFSEATRVGDLLMIPSEYSPGYCLLLDVLRSHIGPYVHVINDRFFLSSTLFKKFAFIIQNGIFQGQNIHQQFINDEYNFIGSFISMAYQRGFLEGRSFHGPCLSTYHARVEQDQAYCFQCSFWPDAAKDWISRNRSHGWPSPEIIHNIVDNGCHVVPIGDPDSPLYLHEWRISFSVAERTLMHSLNHVKFLTYNLLRLALKRIFERRISGVLCSYFMKTTIFYVVENTSGELWQMEEFERCFKSCLSVLYDYIDHKYCPSYFIPEYNMIRRKVSHTNRHLILDLIRTLHSNGIVKTLHLCGESDCLNGNLSLRTMELIQDTCFLHSRHFRFAVQAFNFVLSNSSHKKLESCSNILFEIISILRRSELTKLNELFLIKGVIFYCQFLINHLRSVTSVNKRNYRLQKSIELLLRIGHKADVTTGKLTIATYMYMIGRPKSSLLHIRRMLSEYPPYILEIYSTNKVTNHIYTEVMCCKGHSIDFKARNALAPTYCLHASFANAFPMALKIWLFTQQIIVLDPLSYAYVIESLCHIRLQNHYSLMHSTRCLVDRIADLETEFQGGSRMCFGIIKYVQGDSQLACRWLGSVYITEEGDLSAPIKNQRSAFTYLACLLNRRFRTDI